MHAGGLLRTVHVAAAALLIVGALLVAWRPELARRYEWAFWTGAMVIVVTGFGNLASIGGAARGSWGAIFAWKLAAVAALMLVSGARVMMLGLRAPARAAYALTALVAGGVLAAGLVLAHA